MREDYVFGFRYVDFEMFLGFICGMFGKREREREIMSGVGNIDLGVNSMKM